MKKIFNLRFSLTIISGFIVIALMTHISSCSSDPKPSQPSAQDAVKAKLTANNWKLSSTSVDGVDQTSTYAGLTIQFASGNYTTTNGKAVWPASDTWTFSSEEGTSFKRGDGIDVRVEVTDSTLKLTLIWSKTTLGGGKAGSVSGVNVFSFTK